MDWLKVSDSDRYLYLANRNVRKFYRCLQCKRRRHVSHIVKSYLMLVDAIAIEHRYLTLNLVFVYCLNYMHLVAAQLAEGDAKVIWLEKCVSA